MPQSVTVNLPDKAARKLKEEAKRTGCSVEELVLIALDKAYNALDPSDKPRLHWELCEKYLGEARGFLAKGDPVQASEKAWGAASQAVKALAAKEGRELRSHRELWEYVAKLRERLRKPEVSALWSRANVLHVNFYEDWMPLSEVELAVRDVEEFVGRLKERAKP